jgi:glucoamylase
VSAYWRDGLELYQLRAGASLVVEASQPFVLHVGHDGWQDPIDREADALGFGMYGASIAAETMSGWRAIDFTRRYEGAWEGRDHRIEIVAAPARRLRAHSGVQPDVRAARRKAT